MLQILVSSTGLVPRICWNLATRESELCYAPTGQNLPEVIIDPLLSQMTLVSALCQIYNSFWFLAQLMTFELDDQSPLQPMGYTHYGSASVPRHTRPVDSETNIQAPVEHLWVQ